MTWLNVVPAKQTWSEARVIGPSATSADIENAIIAPPNTRSASDVAKGSCSMVNTKCSYCRSAMRIVTLQIKRAVPPGAKDLGLHDEVTCWQCPKCEQTSCEGVVQCKGCGVGMAGLKCIEDVSALPPDVPRGLPIVLWWDRTTNDFYCPKCLKCNTCNQPLQSFSEVIFHVISCTSSRADYEYCHRRCAVQRNLCLKCLKPLGIMDKFSGRQSHKSC